MGRPKQEYEERGEDRDGTPLQRFERALRKVMTVPKSDIEQRKSNGDSDPDRHVPA